MAKSRIIITGANGFIGSFLVDYFLERDYHITALVHSMPEKIHQNVRYDIFSLENNIPDEVFVNAHYLIHCAYVVANKSINARKINYDGTKNIIELSRKYNLKKIIYLSSFSALDETSSVYGKSKFEIEKLFNPTLDLILKPGLVVGKGGLFKKISDTIEHSRYLPIVGTGEQLIQTIYISDLARCIEIGITNDISGVYAVAENQPITMKTVYKLICKNLNKKRIIIPIPYFIVNAGIVFLNSIGQRPPVTKENLLGLKSGKTHSIAGSERVFNMQFTSLSESIKLL